MLRLYGENEALRERLTAIEAQLAQLDDSMDASRQTQEKLRLLASLEPIHEEVFAAGVGGPLVRDDSGTLPTELTSDLDHTSARLSQMLRQSEIQRQSYGEILTALRSQQDEWDHTPSVRPVSTGFISGRYGRRMDPFTGQAAMHRGIDIAANPGAVVRATAHGVVRRAGLWGSYGLVVDVDHGNGLVSRYAHCSKLLVKRGEKVDRGTPIARVGSTGKATGSHVHYEVIQNGIPQDPMKFVLPLDVSVD
jgi:murein DD-endopeptidase MepM/ murein hydrolase activator NlpD